MLGRLGASRHAHVVAARYYLTGTALWVPPPFWASHTFASADVPNVFTVPVLDLASYWILALLAPPQLQPAMV